MFTPLIFLRRIRLTNEYMPLKWDLYCGNCSWTCPCGNFVLKNIGIFRRLDSDILPEIYLNIQHDVWLMHSDFQYDIQTFMKIFGHPEWPTNYVHKWLTINAGIHSSQRQKCLNFDRHTYVCGWKCQTFSQTFPQGWTQQTWFLFDFSNFLGMYV